MSLLVQGWLGRAGSQRVVLRVLGHRPGISAGTLADVLRLHPSTLAGILHRLERRGLVRRSRDPNDRRRIRLALTAGGRELDVTTPGTVEAVVKRVLTGMAPGRVRPAAEFLAAVAAALLEEPASVRRRRALGRMGRAPVTKR